MQHHFLQPFTWWLRWLRASGLGALIRVSHTTETSMPWHDIIWWKLSLLMKWKGKRGSNQQLIHKNGRFGHMSDAWQTQAHTYTHTRTKKATQTEGQQPVRNLSVNAEHLGRSITELAQSKIHLIKIGSVQFCSNRISHQRELWSWLTAQRDTCDCHSFTLTSNRCVRLCT